MIDFKIDVIGGVAKILSQMTAKTAFHMCESRYCTAWSNPTANITIRYGVAVQAVTTMVANHCLRRVALKDPTVKPSAAAKKHMA